jgi:hypothetical protein
MDFGLWKGDWGNYSTGGQMTIGGNCFSVMPLVDFFATGICETKE